MHNTNSKLGDGAKSQNGNMFSEAQRQKIIAFDKFLDALPKVQKAPNWLIRTLSSIIPSFCIFERIIFVKGRLVCYVPPLCKINPLFNLIMKYRLDSYK